MNGINPSRPGILSLDRIRFWLLLLPCLFVYLITDRSFKGLLIVPLAWLAVDLAQGWKSMRDNVRTASFRAVSGYALIVAFSVGIGSLFGGERIIFRDVFVIASSFALFLFPKGKLNAPQWLFACFTAAYFFVLVSRNFSFSQLADLFTLKLFLPSTSATENDFGIVFGLFTVHFLVVRNWMLFWPSALVSLMVSKRALLLGFIMATTWWMVIGASKRISPRFKTATLLALYLSLMVFSLFMTELGQTALGWFGIENMNVGRFLMGRNNLIMALRDQLEPGSMLSLFGHGPGAADTFLAFNGVGWGPISDQPFNPHNDYMKIIFDYGILGYLVFFAILLNLYGGGSRGKALMVYTITVFCFDNALIFMVFHIVAGFMCAEYVRLEKDGIQPDV